MDRDKIKKLQDYLELERGANDLIFNGQPDSTAVKFLFTHDSEFYDDYMDLAKKYQNKYKDLIDKL